ncbi:60S acidic ribosomal protein P0 [Gregarina niphandrodes]|uniref:60S acidic ribosomal protein P0 n=1 Tax=Gregarina niphandrodes TaxID=110365 RepID=A0A023B201_GRENI|nr:60S acidic ribosomal protein P0 [Gregarina niphandrodes]EZG47334.1 60S acidic ribosomal protein P0 [Gregarina niphandrodes]|eukprot:XP_011132196.1 60S acidic ribosomal protein P0 [Gregarina niphandrodes]
MSTFTASGAKNPKKQEYFERLRNLIGSHSQIMIVEADNVGSKQMADVRFALRDRATILMGKNTMIKTCLRAMVEERPELESLIELVKDNIGMVFCNEEPAAIRKTILEFRVPAPAKQGSLAPCDVYIPPGPTGMDPGQTSFFQQLGIPTKIVKGQIEIQNEVHIVSVGERVSASQAVLLSKLSINPFSYGLKTVSVWDNGSSYPASVLDISQEDVETALKTAINLVAQTSLGALYPTKCSAPHSILNAFRQCAGVGIATDFIFPQIEALKKALDNPDAFAPTAAVAAPAAAAPAATAAAESEAESEDDDMGFGLFD